MHSSLAVPELAISSFIKTITHNFTTVKQHNTNNKITTLGHHNNNNSTTRKQDITTLRQQSMHDGYMLGSISAMISSCI